MRPMSSSDASPGAPPRRRHDTLTFPELFQLPTAVDMTTAARAIGIHVNTAYRLIHRQEFPCAVLRVGAHYRVPTMALMNVLNVEDRQIRLDDVDRGVDFADQFE